MGVHGSIYTVQERLRVGVRSGGEFLCSVLKTCFPILDLRLRLETPSHTATWP
jgi:hypothetical protein